MSQQLGTIVPALGPIQPLIQDNLLATEFEDHLFPGLLYRDDADRERWPANQYVVFRITEIQNRR